MIEPYPKPIALRWGSWVEFGPIHLGASYDRDAHVYVTRCGLNLPGRQILLEGNIASLDARGQRPLCGDCFPIDDPKETDR